MTPTREQFKDFIAAVQKAQQKENKLNKAFEQIWDDDHGQYTPFYISSHWTAIYKAFNIMFGLKEVECGYNELSWWLEESTINKAIYWFDEKEYNVSDVDAFYDFLVEFKRKKEGMKNDQKNDN